MRKFFIIILLFLVCASNTISAQNKGAYELDDNLIYLSKFSLNDILYQSFENKKKLKYFTLIDSTLNNTNRYDSTSLSVYTQYDIEIHKVMYNTEYDGKLIKCSGLLIIPRGVENPPLVVYNHGTLILNSDAPSKLSPKTGKNNSTIIPQEFTYYSTLASNGNIVLVPDYIGYGVSDYIEHPYIIHSVNSKASIDFIYACKNVLKDFSVKYSDKFFIMGISEGALMTVSLHQLINQEYQGKLSVTASYAFAGPYDFYASAPIVMSQKRWSPLSKSYNSWALYSILNYYDMNTDIIFRQTVENGAYFRSRKFLASSTQPRRIFTSYMMQEAKNPEKSLYFQILKKNSIQYWKPSGNLTIVHGQADNLVPCINSKNLYKLLQKHKNVQLVLYPNKSHFSGIDTFFHQSIQSIIMQKI